MTTEPLIKVRVSRKAAEAANICSFDFVPTEGMALQSFSAGSHIDVSLPNGITRQYSLYNSPSEQDHYSIAVLNLSDSRGGSRFLHESLKEGDTLQISHPRNQFTLVEEAGHHVLLAGGIGITPILSMAEQLAHSGGSFELHYKARSAERMAFADYIRSAAFASQSHLYLSDRDQELDLRTLLKSPAENTHLYVCGPKGLIDDTFAAAGLAGWTTAQLHRELFSAPTSEQLTDSPFEVKLASTGRVISVPIGTTVVEALSDAGVEVFTSCEKGLCGTCVTGVLEGIPDHRDVFLSDEEHKLNKKFTPCCSRSKSPMLVLDL